MQGFLIALVVLDSLILLALVIGLWIIGSRISSVADAAESALEEIEQGLPSVFKSAESAMKSIETLAVRAESEMDKVAIILRSTERLVSGIAVAEAASKAVRDSRTTISGVVAGIREALRVLRSPAGKSKEDTENG